MASSTLKEVSQELRVDGAQLKYLEVLSDAEQSAFRDSIRAAKRKQKDALKAATEHSLSYIPALLRGAVRRILFG